MTTIAGTRKASKMDDIMYLQGAAHFCTDDKKLLDAFCKSKRDQGYWVLTREAEPKGWVVEFSKSIVILHEKENDLRKSVVHSD